MTNSNQSSDGGKKRIINEGGTVRGGVVKPSTEPSPRPPAPTGQGGEQASNQNSK